jgi:hypothetical protein
MTLASKIQLGLEELAMVRTTNRRENLSDDCRSNRDGRRLMRLE